MAMMIVVMMISAIVVMVIVFSNDDCGNGNCGNDDISKLFSRSRDVELLFSPEGSEGAVQVMKKVETAFR